jgi:hypothetical protein
MKKKLEKKKKNRNCVISYCSYIKIVKNQKTKNCYSFIWRWFHQAAFEGYWREIFGTKYIEGEDNPTRPKQINIKSTYTIMKEQLHCRYETFIQSFFILNMICFPFSVIDSGVGNVYNP